MKEDYDIYGRIINFPDNNRGPYLSDIIEKIQEEPLINKDEDGFYIRAPDNEKGSRNVHIKGISTDAYNEVYENPDILNIKTDIESGE